MTLDPSSWPGGGGGLPAQWTEDGHGGVLATVDDAASVILSLLGLGGQNANLFEALTSNGLGVSVNKTGLVVVAPDNGTGQALKVYGEAGGGSSIASFLNGASGVLGFIIDKDGRPILAIGSAPADADLSPSRCALWFDSTDGAGNTKLMLKGKSADGTVKTAAIVLS